MDLGRKGIGLLIATAGVVPGGAMAGDKAVEDYPNRPITLVVGFPPGDGSDIVARHLAKHMTLELGQKVVVDNRPGAAGNVGAAAVAKAAPDGYTFFMAARPVALHKALYKHIDYDFDRDFTPVGMVARMPFVLVMGKHVSATSWREAAALVRANPGKFTCASGGYGSTNHLLCEALREKAGTQWVHVPYKGVAAAMVDVLGGRTDFAVISVTAALPLIQSDRMIPLAVFSDGRLPAIPDVPTIEEGGSRVMDTAAHSWYAIMAPTGTPPHMVSRMNRSIDAALANTEVRKRLVKLGILVPPHYTPESLDAFLKADTETWNEILVERQISGVQ